MEYQVIRHDRGANLPSSAPLTIQGANLIDAVKNNFPKILEVSSYYHTPYRYPITVTAKYVQITPDNAVTYKTTPDGKSVAYDGDKGHIQVTLEWMHTTHTDKPETPHTHTVTIKGTKDDLPDTQQFVILGN